jgi:hypothetical protein
MVRRMVVVGMLVVMLSGTALAATNDAQESGSYWGDAGYGALAIVTNIFYMPAKFLYASVGLVTGGLAYVCTVGDSDTAQRILSPSIGGKYVITPAMLRGDEPILFNGPSYKSE